VFDRKSNLSSKKCGRQRIESQDTTLLPGDLKSYKSIDTVYDATEALNYPNRVFKLIGFTRYATS
jgi:hypothetical protein